MEQVLNDLPKGWKLEQLTDVADFIGGSQPPKSEFSYTLKEGFVRLIQIRDYKSDDHKVFVNKKSTKKFCSLDDVMIGRYGPPVFQILRGLEGAYNVALMKAVPNENVLTKDYLFVFLQSPDIQSYIVGLSQRAAGQSGVNKRALENYKIPLPSLDEQKRIVAKLDALFTRVDAAIAHLQETLELSKALFASAQQSIFDGLEHNYKVASLDELCTITSSKRIFKSDYVDDGVPFFRTKEIVELSEGKEISLELFISPDQFKQIEKKFGVP